MIVGSVNNDIAARTRWKCWQYHGDHYKFECVGRSEKTNLVSASASRKSLNFNEFMFEKKKGGANYLTTKKNKRIIIDLRFLFRFERKNVTGSRHFGMCPPSTNSRIIFFRFCVSGRHDGKQNPPKNTNSSSFEFGAFPSCTFFLGGRDIVSKFPTDLISRTPCFANELRL